MRRARSLSLSRKVGPVHTLNRANRHQVWSRRGRGHDGDPLNDQVDSKPVNPWTGCRIPGCGSPIIRDLPRYFEAIRIECMGQCVGEAKNSRARGADDSSGNLPRLSKHTIEISRAVPVQEAVVKESPGLVEADRSGSVLNPTAEGEELESQDSCAWIVNPKEQRGCEGADWRERSVGMGARQP